MRAYPPARGARGLHARRRHRRHAGDRVRDGGGLARYDAADAAAVARRIRAEAGQEAAVDELVGIYREVLAEHAASPAPDPVEETGAASAYLRWLGPFLKAEMGAIEQRERLWARGEHVRLAAERDQARAEQDTLRAEAGRLEEALRRLANELAETRAQEEAVRADRDRA
ncbi:MAG: hypothetical protein E6J83_06470, partial [Deltaproteobacteria bacterium]